MTDLTHEQATWYLAAAFDGEGSIYRISKTRRCWCISLGSTDKELGEIYSKCLDTLQITHAFYIQKTSKGRPWYVVKIHRKSEVASFAELIPSVHLLKRSKLDIARQEYEDDVNHWGTYPKNRQTA